MAASDTVAGDHRTPHSGRLQERTGRSLAVRGKNDTICGSDEWPNVLGFPQILHYSFPYPSVNVVSCDGSSVDGVHRTEKLKSRLRVSASYNLGGLDEFGYAFVPQHPGY